MENFNDIQLNLNQLKESLDNTHTAMYKEMSKALELFRATYEENFNLIERVNELTTLNDSLNDQLEDRTLELEGISSMIKTLTGADDSVDNEREAIENFSNSPLALYRIGYSNGLTGGWIACKKTYEEQEEYIQSIEDALAQYADPGFYHGIGFRFDKPCGGFDEDFSISDSEYDYKKPGKLAREVLGII